MPVLILLQLLIVVSLLLLLIIGPILMLSGKLTRNQKRFRRGLKLFVIPVAIVITLGTYRFATKKFAESQTPQSLAGTYRISAEETSDEMVLRLYSNGDFENLNWFAERYDNGKFSHYANEVWFRSDGHSRVAKIKFGLHGLQLEFNHGKKVSIYEKQ